MPYLLGEAPATYGAARGDGSTITGIAREATSTVTPPTGYGGKSISSASNTLLDKLKSLPWVWIGIGVVALIAAWKFAQSKGVRMPRLPASEED